MPAFVKIEADAPLSAFYSDPYVTNRSHPRSRRNSRTTGGIGEILTDP